MFFVGYARRLSPGPLDSGRLDSRKAFKLEAAAAGAGGVAADSDGRLRLSDLAEDDFRVDFVELHLFERDFAMGRALEFDEFDDFHSGLESGGG